jgi:RNA polymerase sigma-70 factor (ECF subfamily)
MTGVLRANPDSGVRVAWSEELPRHERWLRLVVLSRLGERQAVDEVMQELALGAVAARNVPDDPARLPAWLYRLAVRQALLYRRKLGRRHRLIGRYAERAVGHEPRTVDPMDWLLSDERAQQVHAAVRSLSPRDSEILLLKYASDWSYQQLADHLGIGVAAVEARLHRARGKLRARLERLKVIEV